MNEISYGEPRPEAVRDLSQSLTAQQAAGPASTEALAQNFLARVQRDIDEQVDLRVQQYLATWKPPKPSKSASQDKEVLLGSLGIAVPLTAIAAFSPAGLLGVIIIWIGIILINVAWFQRH